jgi:Chaperone of endosialidase
MKRFSLRYKLLVLTIITLFVSALAADMPFTFKAGDVISAEQMNQNFAALNTAKQERVAGKCPAGSAVREIAEDGKVTCEIDDIGSGSGSAGVDAINGMTGAVILQGGDNITIDDSTAGQIVISSTSAGGTYTADNTSLQLTGTTFSIKDGGVSTTKLADASITSEKIKVPLDFIGTDTETILSVANTNSSATSAAIVGTTGPVGALYLDKATGVWGNAPTYGVYGSSPSGTGVFGVSNTGLGILGRSSTRGIVGTQGSLLLSCAGTYAVGGCAETTGVGVHGFSPEHRGVEGISDERTGVYGFSPVYRGIEGISESGYGVYALSVSNAAIYGKSTSFRGVHGESSTSTGVYGFSPSYRGIEGVSQSDTGVYGTTNLGNGVWGVSSSGSGVFGQSTSGHSGWFQGGGGGSGYCRFNGGAGWSCTSDKHAKENFEKVNSAEILESLAALSISKWNMKGDANQTPHIGPVAQDFYAAFALGDDDVTINTSDAQGVALAAIQGLYQIVQEQQAQIAELEAKLATP